jgi:hypothetical protein
MRSPSRLSALKARSSIDADADVDVEIVQETTADADGITELPLSMKVILMIIKVEDGVEKPPSTPPTDHDSNTSSLSKRLAANKF